MPCLFSSSRIPSPSTYSKAMLAVLGRRLSVSPLTKACGTWPGCPRSRRSRRRLTSVFSAAMCCQRQFAGHAEADDRGRVLGAGAAAAFLMAAAQQRAEARAAAQIQHADAFRRVQLVAGQREHVDLGVLQVDGHLADGLHRVGVEQDALPHAPSRPSPRPERGCRFRCWPTSPKRSATRSLSSDLYSSRSTRPLLSTLQPMDHVVFLLQVVAQREDRRMLDRRW